MMPKYSHILFHIKKGVLGDDKRYFFSPYVNIEGFYPQSIEKNLVKIARKVFVTCGWKHKPLWSLILDGDTMILSPLSVCPSHVKRGLNDYKTLEI